jgi:organic radical activating enzyme
MLSASISSSELFVMEQFYTIQGEGFYSGRAAYFIRLAGCDVGCVWCDVKESWHSADAQRMEIAEIMEKVVSSRANFVVITGGEPLQQNLTELTRQLTLQNIEIAIETSGTYPLHGTVDWYCFSPKKFKKPLPQAYELADELKVVINHSSDFEWAETHAKNIKKTNAKLFLQPEWSKSDLFLPEIIHYVKANPLWNISLQTHKFMDIP